MITEKELSQEATRFTSESKYNVISKDIALDSSLVGTKIFDNPLVGFCDANDELFKELIKKDVVGPQMMMPYEWLDSAVSVISFFLPFTKEIKQSNYTNNDIPSNGWLHGRIEGQELLIHLGADIKEFLINNGFEAIIPMTDERFSSVTYKDETRQGKWKYASFTSNWSERHIAYICGLGTFGLSKGLITEKGIAGRFVSVITNAPFPSTKRNYSGVYDYCINCAACVKRCPVNAITLKEGKDHVKCVGFLDNSKKLYFPRYGCGKCQVDVPCENGIPKK